MILALLSVGLVGCHRAPQPDADTIQILIRTILDRQVNDWNKGRIDDFMRGYAPADSTRFASGGEVSQGWNTVLARYKKKYPDTATMGQLTFSDVDVTVLGPDAALAFGHWSLKRASDNPGGLFTLVFRKTHDGWRIVHDHTSSK